VTDPIIDIIATHGLEYVRVQIQECGSFHSRQEERLLMFRHDTPCRRETSGNDAGNPTSGGYKFSVNATTHGGGYPDETSAGLPDIVLLLGMPTPVSVMLMAK
jgi:hypothetical protein